MKVLPEEPMHFDERSSHIAPFDGDGCAVMSSTRSSENWLLVEWKSGGRDVVYVKSVVSPAIKELKIGDAMIVNRRGEQEAATLIARARERDMLDSMVKRDVAGPSTRVADDDDEGDYASSASSWVPSDDGAQSGDSVEIKSKKIKLERYKRQYCNRRSSKVLTPSNKANAVMNMINRKRSHNDSTKTGNSSMNKSLPDSTKKNQNGAKKVTIDARELKEIRNTFKTLFKILEDMKRPLNANESSTGRTLRVSPELEAQDTTHQSYSQLIDESMEDDKENDISDNDEFNRSDDNVLISNRYSNAAVGAAQNRQVEDAEWVPIGSGKTLIHRDKFKKIKWKSYTVATRTLLLAVFPRRILATHSLTGKRSPAFQNKPPKMCLDPKKISDVIMEVMDRFNVRENLVRSIITTKCADECKMWKARTNKKKSAQNQDACASNGQQ
ncbi:uncharacterized protein LOC142979253 isoform X1 [Anticarsia gemmatalis]|uniref:uncharacterized protein LOC142979253 isoform X1 n=1 Tax=Anticarsia gemmatalis TaxID=129554 RepID=UPI003F76FB6A